MEAQSHSQEHPGRVGTGCWQINFDHDYPEQVILIYKIYENSLYFKNIFKKSGY